jgi:drug/metabolite transporter (DMT)-like permease
MKAIAGAVLVLAGAIFYAAGIIASASLAAANKVDDIGGNARITGGVVGVAGFVLLAIGLLPERPPRQKD